MTDRYYLGKRTGHNREVDKATYVYYERQAGFRNTLGQPNEPATSSFSGTNDTVEICGYIDYQRDPEPRMVDVTKLLRQVAKEEAASIPHRQFLYCHEIRILLGLPPGNPNDLSG